MLKQSDRRSSTRLVVMAAALLAAMPAYAFGQGVLFVEGNKVGVGIETPMVPLHVQKSDGTARILVQETNSTVSARSLLELANNGGPFFIFRDNSIAQSYSFAMGAHGDFIISHQQTPGVELRMTPSGNLFISGILNQGSSREIKTGVTPVDGATILQQVVELPLATWSYSAEPRVRHLGPMAEDFSQQFRLGPNPRVLAPGDTSGVALAAIQGLHELVEQQAAVIEELRQRLAKLEAESAPASER